MPKKSPRIIYQVNFYCNILLIWFFLVYFFLHLVKLVCRLNFVSYFFMNVGPEWYYQASWPVIFCCSLGLQLIYEMNTLYYSKKTDEKCFFYINTLVIGIVEMRKWFYSIQVGYEETFWLIRSWCNYWNGYVCVFFINFGSILCYPFQSQMKFRYISKFSW